MHAQLRRETVGEHSLLYTWDGSDPSLEPILLMGHMDVVPVEPGTEGKWRHGPFEGRIADGFVWGRGTIDDKSAVVGRRQIVGRGGFPGSALRCGHPEVPRWLPANGNGC